MHNTSGGISPTKSQRSRTCGNLTDKTGAPRKTPYRRLMSVIFPNLGLSARKKGDLLYPLFERLISPCVLGLLPLTCWLYLWSKNPCLNRFPYLPPYVPQAGLTDLCREEKRGRYTEPQIFPFAFVWREKVGSWTGRNLFIAENVNYNFIEENQAAPCESIVFHAGRLFAYIQ